LIPEKPPSNRLVFVGGLHRSGTTLLAELLGEHPEISALHDTGVWHDEGQFLQHRYPTAYECGGPGRFAFDDRTHLTEADAVDPSIAAGELTDAWSPFWDLKRRFLVEKSPPNLLRFRYLQSLFPEAHFIAIVRHPVAVAYATAGWSNTSIPALVEHWLRAHEQFELDRPRIRQLEFVRYEDLVSNVDETLARIFGGLGVAAHRPGVEVDPDTNARYLRRWRHAPLLPMHPRVLVARARFGRRLHRLGYGYRFRDAP
jgi:hypothetical protein